MSLCDGDVQESVREYLNHALVAEIINKERSSDFDRNTMELGLLMREAIGIYEDVLAELNAIPDAEIVERSDVRHDRKVDDQLTEAR